VEGVEKCEKLVLDFDTETKEELVSVDPFIVSKLKPHQVSFKMLFISKHPVMVLILIKSIYSVVLSAHNYYVHLIISITVRVSAEISHLQVFLNHVFFPLCIRLNIIKTQCLYVLKIAVKTYLH
jgi:hypothetical protein